MEGEKFQRMRRNRNLTEIPSEFYDELAEHLHTMEREFRDEYQKNPSAPKALLLKEELDKSRKLALEIYEQREEKIVAGALSAIRGGKPDIELLTDEEKTLHENLIDVLNKGRAEMLQRKKDVLATAKEATNELPAEPLPEKYVTVRVLEDIPSFIGLDEKNYALRKDDIITVPPGVATILTKGKKANVI